jgi:hypothetical protein
VRAWPPVSNDGPSAPRRRAARYPSSSGGKDTTPAPADSSAITTHTPKPRHPNRSSPTDASTRPPLPLLVSPAPTRLASRPLDSSPASPRPPHPCPSDLPGPILLPPPRLRPLQLPARAGPSRFLPGQSRKGVRREAADPLPPRAQAGSKGNTRKRGGGLLRSGEKPIERNRWRETQGGKRVSRRLQLPIPRRQP